MKKLRIFLSIFFNNYHKDYGAFHFSKVRQQMEEDKIKVEKALAWPACENVYQMTKKCRGQVLIISNENFKFLSKRDGSSKDAGKSQISVHPASL